MQLLGPAGVQWLSQAVFPQLCVRVAEYHQSLDTQLHTEQTAMTPLAEVKAVEKPAPYSIQVCCKQTAQRYSQFRPQYPKEVYDIVLQHLGPDQRKLAIDVATGSGQAAVQLAQFFEQVRKGWGLKAMWSNQQC